MLEDRDLLSVQEVRGLIARASEAQKAFEESTQEQIDSVVRAIAEAALAESMRLAEWAVEETGIGIVADKHIKNSFVCTDLARYIAPLRTVGIISEDPVRRVTEIAVPMGVVAAIIPTTNPTSTAIFKCLISLKAGNAVVLSPHPKAARCIAEAARVCCEAAVRAGAPEGIIGCVTLPTAEATQELMRHRKVAVILATGGTGLVRAAYSSGKPAFGVGPGNVPAYIDRTAALPKAVRDVLTGKTFDNGTLCSSEQSVIVDAPVETEVVRELIRLGAHFLSETEALQLERVAIQNDKSLNPEIVGKSAQWIAERSGFAVPPATRVLVVRLRGVGRDYPLSCEKLSPILAFYSVKDWREGCERCKEVLAYGGMGHTLAIHCQDEAIIRQFGLEKPAFRICVNTPATHGSTGFSTTLPPSLTLGCGTYGNNITTDNITPLHLIQLKRVAREVREVYPSWYGLIEPQVSSSASEVTPRAAAPAAAAQTVVTEPTRQSKVAGAAAPAPVAEDREPGLPQPVDFVSESDVRSAILRGIQITVGSRTIITPSARDLAGEHAVFVWI